MSGLSNPTPPTSEAECDNLATMASSPFTASPGKTTMVPPAQLNLFHRNPRRGDPAAIAASLRRHSQYKPITGNIGTHTGRPHEILAGNHTLMAFRDLAEAEPDDPRWRKIAVFWVDVDDDMAERIVVADNQTGQLGGFDSEELSSLLEGFGTDIEGLGFTDADIKMLTDLNDGPPDLDDLADEHGEPDESDAHDTVRLRLEPAIAAQWNDHRRGYDSDTEALEALLDHEGLDE